MSQNGIKIKKKGNEKVKILTDCRITREIKPNAVKAVEAVEETRSEQRIIMSKLSFFF